MLLLIHKHIDPLSRGGLLKIRSTEISIDELISWIKVKKQRRFLVCKGKLAERSAEASIIHAQNEIGTLEPVEELAAVPRAVGAPIHVDASQSLGKVPVDGPPGVSML